MFRPMLTTTLLLTLAACGSPSTDTGMDTDAPNTPELATCPSTLVIRDFVYEPDNCQVAAGTTITFINKDRVQHTATSSAGAPVAFDTGTLNRNETATVTFNTPGVYPYLCTIHPDMKASITVK